MSKNLADFDHIVVAAILVFLTLRLHGHSRLCALLFHRWSIKDLLPSSALLISYKDSDLLLILLAD